MYTVKNLADGSTQVYSCCKPKEAVVCAYAQSKGDFNTWNYDSKYSNLVEESELCYLCGDFCVYKEKL